MFRLDEALKVYLHREAIDFRLNINGLALLVEKALGLDPFASCAYVFSNRRRNRVKILGWDRNGLCPGWSRAQIVNAQPAAELRRRGQQHWQMGAMDMRSDCRSVNIN